MPASRLQQRCSRSCPRIAFNYDYVCTLTYFDLLCETQVSSNFQHNVSYVAKYILLDDIEDMPKQWQSKHLWANALWAAQWVSWLVSLRFSSAAVWISAGTARKERWVPHVIHTALGLGAAQSTTIAKTKKCKVIECWCHVSIIFSQLIIIHVCRNVQGDYPHLLAAAARVFPSFKILTTIQGCHKAHDWRQPLQSRWKLSIDVGL